MTVARREVLPWFSLCCSVLNSRRWIFSSALLYTPLSPGWILTLEQSDVMKLSCAVKCEK